MKREISDRIKKEYLALVYTQVAIFIVFFAAFWRESAAVIARTAFSFFLLFTVPGYFIMIAWSERLEFVERLVIGTVISAAATGILSYYLGITGLNIRFHMFLLPVLLSALGILLESKLKHASS